VRRPGEAGPRGRNERGGRGTAGAAVVWTGRAARAQRTPPRSTLGGAAGELPRCARAQPGQCWRGGARTALQRGRGERARSGAGDLRARPTAGARSGTTARVRRTGRLAGEADGERAERRYDAGEADGLTAAPATRGRVRRRGRRAQSNAGGFLPTEKSPFLRASVQEWTRFGGQEMGWGVPGTPHALLIPLMYL
jgi:hypothetical protein